MNKNNENKKRVVLSEGDKKNDIESVFINEIKKLFDQEEISYTNFHAIKFLHYLASLEWRTQILILLFIVGLYAGIVFLVLSFSFNNSEKVTNNIETKIEELNNISSSLEELSIFIEKQQEEILNEQELLESLQNEKEQLEPIITADRETIEAVFSQIEQRNKQDKYKDIAIGFGIGLLTELLVAIILAPILIPKIMPYLEKLRLVQNSHKNINQEENTDNNSNSI